MTDAAASRRGRHSKQKGDNFQRKIAKIFKANLPDEDFYSTPRSGGLRWQQRRDVIGDLVTPADFRFTVECKKHAVIDLKVLFQVRDVNTTDDLFKWWLQACDEAQRAKREPLLVFEWDRGKPVAMVAMSSVPRVCQVSSVCPTPESPLCGTLITRVYAVETKYPQWATVRVLHLEYLFNLIHYVDWFNPPRETRTT